LLKFSLSLFLFFPSGGDCTLPSLSLLEGNRKRVAALVEKIMRLFFERWFFFFLQESFLRGRGEFFLPFLNCPCVLYLPFEVGVITRIPPLILPPKFRWEVLGVIPSPFHSFFEYAFSLDGNPPIEKLFLFLLGGRGSSPWVPRKQKKLSFSFFPPQGTFVVPCLSFSRESGIPLINIECVLLPFHRISRTKRLFRGKGAFLDRKREFCEVPLYILPFSKFYARPSSLLVHSLPLFNSELSHGTRPFSFPPFWRHNPKPFFFFFWMTEINDAYGPGFPSSSLTCHRLLSSGPEIQVMLCLSVSLTSLPFFLRRKKSPREG